MYYFGKRSKENLLECDSRLQQIAHIVIREYGFSVVCGHRGEQDQNNAYEQGFSNKKFPNGKHNSKPSKAFDIIPDDGGWGADIEQFILLAGIVKGVAAALGHKIRWGGDWDSDNDMNDQTFFDLAHFEII